MRQKQLVYALDLSLGDIFEFCDVKYRITGLKNLTGLSKQVHIEGVMLETPGYRVSIYIQWNQMLLVFKKG